LAIFFNFLGQQYMASFNFIGTTEKNEEDV